MTNSRLYPLLTERRLVQLIWGGTQVATWLDLPEPHPERLGESWQVYDANPPLNGPLVGQTVAQVTYQYGAGRHAHHPPLRCGFPTARQVHPDDAYAHSHEDGTLWML